MRYYNSRYNFCLPIEDGVVLYNAASRKRSVPKTEIRLAIDIH